MDPGSGLLPPAAEVAERWRATAGGSPPRDDVLAEVLEALDRHLDTGEPLHCGSVGALAVSDISVLRPLLHDHVASSEPDRESLPSALRSVDAALDTLMIQVTEARVRGLEFDALTDPLTGAGNRRALERDLRAAAARCIRYEHPLAVVMIDVDGLKAINDVDGHDAGDRALRRLSDAFTAQLRASDGFYRIGGDEFVAVLTHADGDAAAALIERVRESAPGFTAGIAVAPHDGHTDADLLDVADRDLLHRRDTGRGRPSRPARAPRGADVADVAEVVASWTPHEVTVQVTLADRRTGRAVAPLGGDTIAAATAALVASGIDGRIGGVEVAQVGQSTIATVVVHVSRGTGEVIVTAAAPVHGAAIEAAARAVTDALGRLPG